MTSEARGPGQPTALIASACVLAWAAGLAFFRWKSDSLGTPGIGPSSVAFGAAFAAAGLAALTGEARHAPWIVAAAGMALVPMSVVTFSPVAFLLLFPASFLIVRGLAQTQAWPRGAGVPALAIAVLAFSAVAVLIFHHDPAKWQASDGSQRGASDIITTAESRLSLVLSASVILVAALPIPSRHRGR